MYNWTFGLKKKEKKRKTVSKVTNTWILLNKLMSWKVKNRNLQITLSHLFIGGEKMKE